MSLMDGVLLIDKPAGMTSHDVVARVRKIIGERRVGHTGTLDPFATGLLVILVGRATRLAQFLSGADKEYEALIRLGYGTETGDLTGERIGGESRRSPQDLNEDEIEAALASLRGEIDQMPPMYSAKKIQGKKLYEFARQGQEVERQPVRVTIYEFEALLHGNEMLHPNSDGTADLRVRVACSAGTYIRTLAEDFGEKLGVGAHLVELRRMRAGRFAIASAATLDALAELATSESLDQAVISPKDALSDLPLIELDDESRRRAVRGNDLDADQRDECWKDGEAIRMVHKGELVAVGRFDAQKLTIHPAVVLTSA